MPWLTRFRIVAVLALLFAGAPRDGLSQQIREQVTVDAVQIRLLAFDAAGAPLEDLRSSDLLLRVDGQVVSIDTLVLEERPMPPVTPSPGREATVEQARAPSEFAATAAVMIVMDESAAFSLAVRKEALGQLMSFVEADPRASEFLVASYSLGSLRLNLGWTNDRAKALSALRRLRDHRTAQAPSGLFTAQSTAVEFQMLRAGLQTALMQALGMFPDGPITRQLLIVTGGGTLAPLLDLDGSTTGQERASPSVAPAGATVPDPGAMDTPAEPFGNDFELWSLAVGGRLAQGDNRALEAKAIERDVALVPIAISRMKPVGYGDVAIKARQQFSGLSTEIAANQALWGLARETGGGSVILGGKAASELARRNARAAYLLSFRYGAGGTGRFHRVSLSSNRPGVTLEYRRGFRIRTPEERMLDTVFARVVLPDTASNDLSLTASLAPSGADGSHTLLTVRFSPPAESGAGSPRSVMLVAVGRDSNGTWTQPLRWVGEAGPDGGSYVVRLELAIPPASRSWSVGLRDVLTSLDGYALAAPPTR